MPALTPEQEALKQAALVAMRSKGSPAKIRQDECDFELIANPAAILALLAQLEAAQANTDKLLTIIASAYQIAGAHDAPAHILDVLADPEAATDEQVEAMLPYRVDQSVIQIMREKFESILDFSDYDMKDGDAARQVAREALDVLDAMQEEPGQ